MEGMAMTVKIVPITKTISASIKVKPLESPRSPLLAVLSVLFRGARMTSNILPCLYTGGLKMEPAPMFSRCLLREVPPWIEQLPGQALSDLQVHVYEYVREDFGYHEIPSPWVRG
jgi:hypothetical protein